MTWVLTAVRQEVKSFSQYLMTWVLTAVRQEVNYLESSVEVHELELVLNLAL